MWASGRGSETRRALKRLLARSHPAYRWARRLYILGRYACRRPHEADFAAFRWFRQRTGLFLDVGANCGESVLSFRLFNPRASILSIEPNPYHEPDLRFLKRWVPDFDYRLCAAGDQNGTATLYVPVYGNLPLTGEASFLREQALANYWVRQHLGHNGGDAVRLLEVPVAVVRLDDLELKPDFIKIDVQGYEPKVVAGLRHTIEATRPVLLVERSGCDDALHAQLAALNYSAFVYDARGDVFSRYRHDAAQNLFFLPDDTQIPLATRPPALAVEAEAV